MFAALAFSALLVTGAQAHFRLLYPPIRGPFDADGSLEFCGGHTNANASRTVFPLNGGYINSAVAVAVGENPDSFDDFGGADDLNFVRYWANELKGGDFCIPIDIGASGVEGVEDGANVTIQVIFNGDDGQLYQCADLTLSATATLPEGDCKNTTKEIEHSASGSHSAGAPNASGEPDEGGSALRHSVVSALGLGLAGVVAAVANAL
ncbi:hypothetical protein BKA70DRAFT_1283145 [Coprinopsis sp. MPI-PUGE-AT-0042]|nr:hypothetical protein BKA70DRAFT_1283145 [Coprinopsis sp. MPI-PUGE-AT-0042]